MSGWIADYRKELESNIWLMPPMYHRVWQWIKYSVNHKEAKIPNRTGGVTVIKPGQRATSYRQIAKGVGYYESVHKWKEPNTKTVKVILDWLANQGMIAIEGNSEGTVITVANWSLYQDISEKGNDGETLKKHRADTNNNESTMKNNNKQKKKEFIPPTLDEIIDYVIANQYCVNPKDFYDKYNATNWCNKDVPISNWKLTLITWNKNELKREPYKKPYEHKKSNANWRDGIEVVERIL